MGFLEILPAGTEQKSRKPVLRDLLKSDPDVDGKVFSVIRVGLNAQKTWVVLQTEDWIGFIDLNASLAKELLQVLDLFASQWGKALKAEVDKAERFCFSLYWDDEEKRYYDWVEEEMCMRILEEAPKVKKKPFRAVDGLFVDGNLSESTGESTITDTGSLPQEIAEEKKKPAGRPKKNVGRQKTDG